MSENLQEPKKLRKRLRRLKNEITCPLCHDVYEDPKLLPCCHYYCKECIVRLASEKGQPFPCPECRKDTFLVQDSADRLPPAFFVNRLKSAVNLLQKCDSEGVLRTTSCDQCKSEASAVAFCRQCAHFICEFCEQAHQRQKFYSDHVVVKIEQLGDDKPVRVKTPKPMKCKIHREEQLKIYCFTCEELICRDCTVIDHKDHQYEFVVTYAPRIKQDIERNLGSLEEAQEKLLEVKTSLESVQMSSHNHKVVIEDEIKRSCSRITKIVEEYHRELLDQVHSKVNDNLTSLTTRETSLEVSVEEVQGVVRLVRNATSSGSEEEVVSVHKQLQEKIKEETARINALDLTPVVEPFSDVLETRSCEKRIKDALRESIKVIPLAFDQNKCTVKGFGAETAETNSLTRFMLTTCSQNGKPFSVGSKSIKAELKSTVDESVLELKVSERHHKGTYQLFYTPKVRGHHQLTITVNEQPIYGSPFPVFVKHPPNQLGEPVRIINNVGIPMDITINQEGHLLVSDMVSDGILHTLTKDGEKIGNSRQLNCIRSTAIDREGCFIVTVVNCNTFTHSYCVLKFNQKWDLIKGADFMHGFTGGRVKISPANHYYICETCVDIDLLRNLSKSWWVMDCIQYNQCRSPSKVVVYDKELKLLFELAIDSPSNDVAFGTSGCVYVSCWNGSIYKFNDQRQLVITIKTPSCHGIALVDDLLYTVDNERNCVLVYKTSGERVTRFGSEKELNSPSAIAIDENGFVYVCCSKSGTVVVY